MAWSIFIDFAEKLFKQLEKSKDRFEVKVMLLNLISRLIGVHKVCTSFSALLCLIHFFLDISCLCSTSTRLFKDSCNHTREVQKMFNVTY